MTNNKEILVKPNLSILIKTDHKGVIEYASEYLSQLTGYEVFELVGKEISFLRHPDMPATIINHLWNDIFQQKKTKSIIKHISKSGDPFWLQVRVDYKKVNTNTSLYLNYSQVSQDSIQALDKIYKALKNIKIHSGEDIAENYFNGILEEKSVDFNGFIEEYFDR